MNSYLLEVQECTSETLCSLGFERLCESGSARDRLVKKYSFAIPDDEAIDTLVFLSPIIELGAGTGYWAKLVHEAGGAIRAFDNGEGKYGFADPHFPVKQGDETILAEYGPEWTLFLCWPCYNTPFAYNALKAFAGDKLVYVGEDEDGCTGDYQFHEELDRSWVQESRHWIPKWSGMHDRMIVYKRKETQQ